MVTPTVTERTRVTAHPQVTQRELVLASLLACPPREPREQVIAHTWRGVAR